MAQPKRVDSRQLLRWLRKYGTMYLEKHWKDGSLSRKRILVVGVATPFKWSGTSYHESCFEWAASEFDAASLIDRMKDYDRNHNAGILTLVKTSPNGRVLWRKRGRYAR